MGFNISPGRSPDGPRLGPDHPSRRTSEGCSEIAPKQPGKEDSPDDGAILHL